ncbi:MAG: ParA family protein [Deltaproteobacteria bacterium]|nr:ParA family protein [Deltaproteobacteria bacterium]
MGITLAIANQKGGCGKTTTATSLAACWAMNGSRVLLVDCDPQANASYSFGLPVAAAPVTLWSLFERPDLGIEYGLYKKGNLHLLCGSPQLARAEREWPPGYTSLFRLSTLLGRASGDYDYIVIDCPPSTGLLTQNALAAADRLIVPVDIGFYSLIGITQLLARIEEVREVNPRLEILGFVLTQYDGRAGLSSSVRERLEQSYPGRVFQSVIRPTVRLKEAPSHELSIFEYDPNGNGSRDYRALALEVETWLKSAARSARAPSQST